MKRFSLTEIVAPATPIVVVDIGASLLDNPPYATLLNSGCARLIAFEPNAEECRKLQERFPPPHRIFQHFVGDGQPATFHETNWFATGSLLRPNRELLEKFQHLHEVTTLVKEHSVATVALDDIAEIGDIDYIKIDVQGGELAVFKGAGKALGQAVLIHTEVEFVELYESQPLFADVDVFLRGRGFDFVRFTGFGSRALKPVVINRDVNAGNQQLWADAIYMRKWVRPEAIASAKLIKLAILAHDVYGFVDFTQFLLTELDKRTNSALAPAYMSRLMS